MTVLLAGVVLSFITPFGGFVQMGGLLLFYWNVEDYLVTRVDLPQYSFFRTELAYGFFVGMVAMGMTVLSLFLTLDRRPIRDFFRCSRILTWTLSGER